MIGSNPTDDAVIVALGANLPGAFASVEAALEAALARASEHGMAVVSRSRWWRSAAWPDPSAPGFLNGAALVDTRLDARGTLEALLAIEVAFGRRRSEPNAPRTLDLDLIAHGRTVMDEGGLTLPHPRAHQRRFVMGPLAEIAPAWVHPTLKRTASVLFEAADVGRDAAPIPGSRCTAAPERLSSLATPPA